MVREGEATKAHGHEVTVTSMTTVAPALPVQEHRLALSNLDLLLPPMDVGVFFCYAGDGAAAALPAILKAALAEVLVAYYPLAGEVVATAAGEGELLCSGRGVDFAEASAGDAALCELRLGVVDESAEKLVPKKKAGVMCVQVTKFKCGGAVVGCTFDHRVCDAYSFNIAGYVMPMPSARGDGDWVVYVHAAPEVVKAMEAEPATVFQAIEPDYVFGQA
uniref:Uncharacterized protein n=1 Tax=Oryza brachyantha TaxID=4533 RepID=J3M193_ORYBR